MDRLVSRLACAVLMQALRDAPRDPRVTLAGLKPWATAAGLRPTELERILQDAQAGKLADLLGNARERDAWLLELGYLQPKLPRGKAPRWGPFWT